MDAVRLEGWTPLHLAAAEGHESAVRLIVALGARLDAMTTIGATALQIADAAGHEHVRRALLELAGPCGTCDDNRPNATSGARRALRSRRLRLRRALLRT